MKRKELFDTSVSVLTKAYMNDTLQHGSCSACAVGNLVSAGVERDKGVAGYQPSFWGLVVCTLSNGQGDVVKRFRPTYYEGAAAFELDATGYNCLEIQKIESAFESTSPFRTCESRASVPSKVLDESMFKGLCAVYDALCEIHEVTEQDNVPTAELVFAK